MKTLAGDLRLPHGLALFLAPMVAVLMYARTLDGSFLSDDFLLNIMLDKTSANPRVLWEQVFADFGRGWLEFDQTRLYRPLVTLSAAVNYALGGADPFGYHVFNVLFHAAATFACGLLCGLCCPYRPNLAAVLGGALFALHPAAAESACWIAGRSSGMELMWRLLAMAGFALYLRRGLRRDLVLAAVASLLACATKETAVMIPVGFLALDLLMTPSRPWGQRLKLHLLFAPIWLGYFVVRRVVLGAFIGHATTGGVTGEPAGGFAWARIGLYLEYIHNKLVMVFVPFLPEIPLLRQILFYLLVVASVTWAVRQPLVRSTIVFGFVWLVMNYLPSFELDVVPYGLLGGRMLYGSVAVMAIITCMLAVRLWDQPRFVPGAMPGTANRLTPTERLHRWGVFGTITVMLGAFALGSNAQVQRYQLSYQQVQALQKQLVPHAQKSTPERPLVLVSAMGPAGASYFLNCNALFTLTEIPIATADKPLVSLGFIWQPVPPLSKDLEGDVSSLRAMWHMGGELLVWDPTKTGSFAPAIDAVRSPDLPKLLADGPRRMFTAAPVNTLRIEAVKITTAEACTGGRLRWLLTTASGPDYHKSPEGKVLSEIRFRAPTATTTFHVDLSHDQGLLTARNRLAGFEVEFADADSSKSDREPVFRLQEFDLVPICRLQEFDLQRRLLGDEVRIGEESQSLLAPESPAPGLELYLVLLGPDAGAQLAVAPGSPVLFPPLWITAQKTMDRISRQRRYYYFFEARSPTGQSLEAYRTPVDWFILKRP